MARFFVVGIQKGINKKGEPFRKLHLSQAFDNPEHGVGSRVSEEFINGNVDITGIKPGMEVDLSYRKGYDGKAYIDSVALCSK